MQDTRQTLIQRVRQDADESSWSEFDKTYRPYIIGIVRKMNFDYHENEDLAQLILMKLWKGMADFEYRPNECKFRSWVAIVSKNAIRDFIANKQRKVKEQSELELDLEDRRLGMIDEWVFDEWKEFVSQRAWTVVEEKFSQNVIDTFLMFSKGLKAEDIANELKMDKNTVYVYKKRVEAVLKSEILKLNRELG